MATVIVLLLMIGYFISMRSLAHVLGDAPTLLVIIVLIALVTTLDLHLEAFVRERRRERVGKCDCGYDLRATNERCPECGRVFFPLPSGEGTGEGASVTEALSNSQAPSP